MSSRLERTRLATARSSIRSSLRKHLELLLGDAQSSAEAMATATLARLGWFNPCLLAAVKFAACGSYRKKGANAYLRNRPITLILYSTIQSDGAWVTRSTLRCCNKSLEHGSRDEESRVGADRAARSCSMISMHG